MTTILIVAGLSLIPFTIWYICKEYDTAYYIANLVGASMDDAKEIKGKLENLNTRM